MKSYYIVLQAFQIKQGEQFGLHGEYRRRRTSDKGVLDDLLEHDGAITINRSGLFQQLGCNARLKTLFDALEHHGAVDRSTSFGESGWRVVLAILTKLLESVHGDASIVLEEIQGLAIDVDF